MQPLVGEIDILGNTCSQHMHEQGVVISLIEAKHMDRQKRLQIHLSPTDLQTKVLHLTRVVDRLKQTSMMIQSVSRI